MDLHISVGSHVVGALRVLGGQHAVGTDGGHHLGGVGVHDGKVQPGHHGHSQKRGVQVAAAGQAKADVGNAQHGAHAQLLFAAGQGFQRLDGSLLLGAGGKGQAVNVNILVGDANGVGGLDDALGNGKAAISCVRDAVLVQRQTDDGGTVLFAQRQDHIQRALLAVDRVDDGFAVIDTQGMGEGVRVGGVQLQGQIGDGLQVADQLLQRGRLIDAGQTGVDVQHLGTGLGLGHCLGAGVGTVPFPQGLLQPLFAGGVDALTYHSDAGHVHKAHRRTQAAAANGNLLRRGKRVEGLF